MAKLGGAVGRARTPLEIARGRESLVMLFDAALAAIGLALDARS